MSADGREEIRFEGPPGVRGGFTMVPNWILRDPSLGLSDKMVWAALLSYAWDPARRSTFAGQTTIAADLGVDVATVKRAMVRLRAAGLLASERRGLGLTSVHVLKWQIAPTDGANRADGRGASAPTVGAPTRRHEEDEGEEDEDQGPPLPPRPAAGGPVRTSEEEEADDLTPDARHVGPPDFVRPAAPKARVGGVPAELVDDVIARWNAITGSSMRTGPTRSLGTAEVLAKCLLRLSKAHGGLPRAADHLVAAVAWKWAADRGGDGARWCVPTTVCRPGNLARIEEGMAAASPPPPSPPPAAAPPAAATAAWNPWL